MILKRTMIMNEISSTLKKKFCKDMNIPINIFKEPYFTERLDALDKLYDCKTKYAVFCDEMMKYANEEEFFAEYNRVKDEMMTAIKSKDGYAKFMDEVVTVPKNYPTTDIYKDTLVGHKLVSIDMSKANFNTLRSYDASIFDNCATWELFVSQFTDNKHIQNSKYIRQVVMGNCNPKRQINYEKHIMEELHLKMSVDLQPHLVSFASDELVYDITDLDYDLNEIRTVTDTMGIPLKIECFELKKIAISMGQQGYLKQFDDGHYVVKCVDNDTIHFICKYLENKEITDNDKVFYYKGILAILTDVPIIKVVDMC